MRVSPENILLAYFIFTIVGWFLELCYRSLKAKKVTNPGFLSGPYLPIHGFGGLVAYFISVYSEELSLIGSALFFLFAIFLLEFSTGIFFKKIFKIRLWDYSDRKLNVNGYVCPTFLFYWLFLGAIFRYFLFPYFDYLIREFALSGTQVFFLGFFYGIFLIDTIQSFDLAYKVRETMNQFNQDHISGRVFALKNLYGEVSFKLNEKINLSKKTTGIKQAVLYFVNYFRLAGGARKELEEIVRRKIRDVSNNKD